LIPSIGLHTIPKPVSTNYICAIFIASSIFIAS
jgi:hypothetical protein